MTDFFTKLRILTYFLFYAFGQWKSEIWKQDLDQDYCCDGRECGCDGVSVREAYTNRQHSEVRK